MWRVVKDTMPLRNSLIQIMTALGLERRKPPPEDLTSYLEQEYPYRQAMQQPYDLAAWPR